MFVLLIMMFVGYLCRRVGMLNEISVPIISKIVLNIGIPATVIVSVMQDNSLSYNMLLLYLVGFMLFNIMCACIAKIVVKTFKITKDANLFQFMYMFSNIGFMGFPVLQAILGEKALLYAVLFLIPSNLMMFSYGEQLMNNQSKFTIKKLMNAPIIASFIALLICVFNIQIPEVLIMPLRSLSNVTTPLAMMIIGISLYGHNILKVITDKQALLFTTIKLMILPCIYCLILNLFHIPILFQIILVLMMAMPIPSNTIVYASLYNKNIDLVGHVSILTSILCVFTIPLQYHLVLFLNSCFV
ncbi:AEC family transporter [Amedibacillus sp. YH-ame10]